MALMLAFVGCAGSAPPRSNPPRDAPGLPAAPGVELRLSIEPRIWERGVVPRVEIQVVNRSTRAIVMMPPQDGSWWGQQDPDYNLEFLDERGAIVPGAVGQQGGCGRLNGYRVEHLMTVSPGARASLHDAPEAHPYPFSTNLSSHPGRHRVRLRYRADMPGGTPVELVSNSVEVTIAGTDADVWTCYNDPAHIPPPYVTLSHAPRQAIAFGDGYLVLDRHEHQEGEHHRYRRWRTWWLYHVGDDGELRGAPLSLRAEVGVGDVQLAAIDGGVWVVAGAGPALRATQVQVRHDVLSLAAPVVWAEGIRDPQRFAVTTDAVLYFGQEIGDDIQHRVREVLLRRIVDAAPVGDATVVALARDARDLALARDPGGGWWAGWSLYSQQPGGVIQQVGRDGAPLGPERPISGETLRVPERDVSWGPGGAVAVLHGQHLGLDAVLRLARAHTPVQTWATTWTDSLSPLAIRGAEWLVVWSDDRAARAAGCVAADNCVGELWITIEQPGGPRVPPRRLTHDSRSRPDLLDDGYRSRCYDLHSARELRLTPPSSEASPL